MYILYGKQNYPILMKIIGGKAWIQACSVQSNKWEDVPSFPPQIDFNLASCLVKKSCRNIRTPVLGVRRI